MKTEKYVPPWASEARFQHHHSTARIIALGCCLAVVIGFRAVPKVLKIILGKSKRRIECEGKVGCCIAQLQQTVLGHLIPPARKQKRRFINLRRIAGWSTDTLTHLQLPQCPTKVIEKPAWVKEFKKKILEWSRVCELIDRTLKQVREKGVREGHQKP